MRILGIADAGYVHTRKWASYLAGRGHAVLLISTGPTEPHPPYPPGVTVAPWRLPLVHIKRFWLTLGSLTRLRRTARDFQPHLIHAHFLGPGAWYATLGNLRPLVVSIMGGDITGSTWRAATWREAVLSRLTLKAADLAICWSEQLRRTVTPYLRSSVPCEIVVGGVDVDVFCPKPSPSRLRMELGFRPDDFVILSPRLVWPLYNIHVIVRAFTSLRASVPGARLILLCHSAARHEDYLAEIRRLVQSLDLQESVRMVPPVQYQQMPDYFRAADCTVSIPDSDGTPMAVLESLACGTPAVVHDLPEYDPDLFADQVTVLRTPRRDPDALAASLAFLAREGAVRARLAHRGRQLVRERADYRREMERLEALYANLLAGSSA
jgi:glycosyltransferase involved in cell wall biosynthesis